MKIYTVVLDTSRILEQLKDFKLYEFKDETPIIFVEAPDPDEACYMTMCKFAEILLKQDESNETALLLYDVFFKLRIIKVFCKDEKRL